MNALELLVTGLHYAVYPTIVLAIGIPLLAIATQLPAILRREPRANRK